MKTLKSLTKTQFNKLPNTEKRILLAQDVLAQLKAKKYVSQRGDYIKLGAAKKNIGKLNKVFAKELENNWDYGVSLIFDNTSSAFENLSAKDCFDEADKCFVCAKGSIICSFVQNFNKRKIGEIHESDPEITKIFGDELWDELERQFEESKKSLSWLMNNIVENKGFLKVRGKLIG